MDGPIAEGTAQKKYLIQIIQIGRLIANRMVWYDNFMSMIWSRSSGPTGLIGFWKEMCSTNLCLQMIWIIQMGRPFVERTVWCNIFLLQYNHFNFGGYSSNYVCSQPVLISQFSIFDLILKESFATLMTSCTWTGDSPMNGDHFPPWRQTSPPIFGIAAKIVLIFILCIL